MADPTTRDLADQLAKLQGTVREQGAELAAYRRQRRRAQPFDSLGVIAVVAGWAGSAGCSGKSASSS